MDQSVSLLTCRLETWIWYEDRERAANFPFGGILLRCNTHTITKMQNREKYTILSSRVQDVDNDANNTSIVYVYMRVCLECKIDTRKESGEQYKPFTSAPAPKTKDILDLIVHGDTNDNTEGD
jgi:hypothetical protein